MIRPKILVFDSGLGGLTVFRAIRALRPFADFTYVADDAGFPYGPLAPHVVVERVVGLMAGLVETVRPDLVVIACNTASTLVLPPLRAAFPALPFVGTVPAVKPAAEQSHSRMISVLATPGTVARDYTRDLIAAHAAHCDVTLVGAPDLAPLAERFMRGEAIEDEAVAREIAACFVANGERRTDHVVLACTHYPLLLDVLTRLAPWPVEWVDPAPAIARRVEALLAKQFPGGSHESGPPGSMIFTSGRATEPALQSTLAAFGLGGADASAAKLRAARAAVF